MDCTDNSSDDGLVRVASFNLHGFKNSWEYLRQLLDCHDIVFVQELWLFACELSLLSNLSDSFNVFAQSGMANSEQSGIVKGRPFGGVAVFIRKDLCKMASLGAVDDNGRVVCVKLVTGNLKMLFFGCYFPFNDKSSDYTNRVADVCGFIESVCYDFSDYKVCVMGDLNFECNTSDSGFIAFSEFGNKFKLVTCDDLVCNNVNFTYNHITLGHRSWLDHVFISDDCRHIVCNFNIVDSVFNTSDHFPVSFCLSIPDTVSCNTTKVQSVRDFRWDRGNTAGFYNETGVLLNKIIHKLSCDDDDEHLCCDYSHLLDIDIYYNEIIFALTKAADNNIPKVPKSAMKHYWSIALDDLKSNSISTYNSWIAAGKPKQGWIFQCMKDAKYKYKLAVRDAIRLYENRFSDELFEHLMSKDMQNFWKVWSNKASNNVLSVGCIDGSTDDFDIANVFRDKFSSLSMNNNSLNYNNNIMNDSPASLAPWIISVETVDKIVFQQMKRGKAAGYDNLTLEHIIHSHPSLICHLCKLFNMMLKHCYVPNAFGCGIIIPLVKDKRGDVHDSDNYRGITISPVLSKVFELCLLDTFESFLSSHHLQIGFKKKIGCAPGVFLMQSTVDYFVSRGSPAYIACIDASKAFDRINHAVLMKKLVERGAPKCFIGVLISWYSKLFSCVRWNGVFSKGFDVTCGVRQGGILSPLLFNVYVDELIDSLEASGCGCHIGKEFFGCIMYADDLILLSPSVNGLQHMLNICDLFASNNSLVFNIKKTCCAAIGRCRCLDAKFYLDNQVIPWSDVFKYLGVHFICGYSIEVDVKPVKRHFYAACNSILTKSRGTDEPVRVQLIKSYCLPILMYCIGALRMKRTSLHQLSVCWNDVFRKIFHYKRFESVKCLQDMFGTMDLYHLYDLYRWKFFSSLYQKCKCWSNYILMHDSEFRICDRLKCGYMFDHRSL